METKTIEGIESYSTDASPSWNGFNHQGKVAIYVVLKMFREGEISEEDISKYELELEWLEDFSIKKDGRYKSIHQVKTYDDTATSKYKEAIWLLLAKLLELDELENAFLHVTQSLTKFDKLIEKLPTYTIPEDKSYSSRKSMYLTPKECKDKVLASGNYENVYSKFDLYTYLDGIKYCSLDDIEQAIQSELKEIIGGSATILRVERAYYYLLGLVDNNIRERHINIQTNEKDHKVTISFIEIKKIVDNNFETISKEYAAYFLKNEFFSISQSYLEDLFEEYHEGKISINEITKFCKIIERIYDLNTDQFLDFCLRISPNNGVNKEEPDHILKMLNQCLNKTGINDCFFETLMRVKSEFENDKWVYTKKTQGGRNISYLPTTIADESHGGRNRKLADAILHNQYSDLLNEVDKIITKSINLPSLGDSKVYKNIPDPEDENDILEMKSYDRITKVKNISLIDITTAREELLR